LVLGTYVVTISIKKFLNLFDLHKPHLGLGSAGNIKLIRRNFEKKRHWLREFDYFPN